MPITVTLGGSPLAAAAVGLVLILRGCSLAAEANAQEKSFNKEKHMRREKSSKKIWYASAC
jgi:hypothetical protein